MSEAVKWILLILILIGMLLMASVIVGWKMKRACAFIVRELKEKKAFDPASAVELAYDKPSMFSVGLRDYRPNAIEELAKHNVIRMTAENRYYYIGK